MALPNGAGGYQVGDGNLSEVQLGVQGTPVAKTAAATLTAQELTAGIITYTGAAVNLTLPVVVTAGGVTGVNDVVSSAKTDSAFKVTIINIGGTNAATVVVGTGWTIVGLASVAANTSAQFLARKTSDTTYTLYRVA